VPEQKDLQKFPTIEKQFVNYMFFRVHPDWRKLDAETKDLFKSEFQTVYAEYSSDFLLFSYSLIGFDSKADLMFWRIGDSLDRIQEMTARLYRTNFGSYLETADTYLSTTKKMMFVGNGSEDRFHVNAGAKKYHFLYPCAKHRDWLEKTGGRTTAEDELLNFAATVEHNSRLACQIRMSDALDGLRVRLPESQH